MSSNFYTTGGNSTSNNYNYQAPSSFPFTEAQLSGNSAINKRIDYWVFGNATGSTSNFQNHTWYNSGGYDLIEVFLVGGGGGGGGGDLGSITGFPRTIWGGGGGGAGGLSYYKVVNPSGNIDFEIGPGGAGDSAGGDSRAYSPYSYMFANGGARGLAGYNVSTFLGTQGNAEANGSYELGQVSSTVSVINISGFITTGANRKIYGPSAGGYGYSHITGGTFINQISPVISNFMNSIGQTVAGRTGTIPGIRTDNQLFAFLAGGNGGAGGARGANGTNGGWPGGGGGGGGMNWAGSGAYTLGGTGANGCAVVIGYKF